jgi:hypothetical protein
MRYVCATLGFPSAERRTREHPRSAAQTNKRTTQIQNIGSFACTTTTMMMRTATLLLLLAAAPSQAFMPASSRQASTTARWMSAPTAEESAKALQDYMSKSHEEKLKAVKAAELKSQTEIEVRCIYE